MPVMRVEPIPRQAFVLGAGLGTRLRPLTEHHPKPLIPVWDRPLITHAFDHLRTAGVERFIVNTHWHPEAYEVAFPGKSWHGLPIMLRHEPVLLETAGGIANVADLLGRAQSFWVYNGDILSTLPLAPAVARHLESNDLCTLILRSAGAEKVVAFDQTTGLVRDLRNLLGTGLPMTHQFTGLYLCRPQFLDRLRPGKVESSRTIFLDLIRAGEPVGGAVIDEGLWLDLGDRAAYLEAHRLFPNPDPPLPAPPGVELRGACSIAAEAVIAPGAVIEDCVIWPGARVTADARLTRCVVRGGQTASGIAIDRDF
jgi:mannose-1-phosphate guanylyltransferase